MALTLALGNSTCRVRSNTSNDDGEDEDGGERTPVLVLLPLPGVSAPHLVALPTIVGAASH